MTILRHDLLSRYSRAIQLLLLFLLIALWELVVRLQVFTPLLFPSLLEIGKAFFESLASGELLFHLSRTLIEIFFASLFAAIIGIPAGIILGSFRFVRSVFEPLLLISPWVGLNPITPQ